MMNKIKYIRNVNKLTQQKLADYLNISRGSVNAWESDLNKPSTSEIILMSNIFNVSTQYFLNPSEAESLIVSSLTKQQRQVLENLVKCFSD